MTDTTNKSAAQAAAERVFQGVLRRAGDIDDFEQGLMRDAWDACMAHHAAPPNRQMNNDLAAGNGDGMVLPVAARSADASNAATGQGLTEWLRALADELHELDISGDCATVGWVASRIDSRLAAPAAPASEPADFKPLTRFVTYLNEHCTGQTITEESLEEWLLDVLDSTPREVTVRPGPHRLEASAPAPAAQAEGLEIALDAAHDALLSIGNFAHDNSTGPAVPDALWEIRSMAYDAVSSVFAGHAARRQDQSGEAAPDTEMEAMFEGRAENTGAISANYAVNSDRTQIIARAVQAHGRAWPEQLTSGVMFYEGERITKAEFLAEVRI